MPDTEHLAVYRDIGRLLVKYGRREDLVGRFGLRDILDEEVDEDTEEGAPEELADDLEALGPTFIKLGQVLATRADLLPPAYLKALSRLEDDVAPVPFAEVERIVEGELGVRLSKAFAHFESEPIASASLGQVHRAELRDGRPVAVKVQRPGIRTRVGDDLDALERLAELADRHTRAGRHFAFSRLLAEFRRSLRRELDYRQEAENLVRLRDNLSSYDRIVVPEPIADYTTDRVLTMQLVEGRKITSLGPLAQMEIGGRELAEDLFSAYLDQILADGFLHADPHPGNVFITDDGRLALLDLGMVAHLTKDIRESLLKLLLAVTEGEVEEALEAAKALGEELPAFDEDHLRREMTELVAQHQQATAGEIEVGTVVMEVSRVSREAGLRPPPELALLIRALLNLDRVGRALDPDFDPNEAVRRNAGELMTRQMWASASPSNLFAAALEAKEFAEKLPGRVNRIAEALADGEFTVNVDSLDEDRLVNGLHRVANRIAMGLVIASLILGAAMLMQVETETTILGYPALAMVFFLIAALAGLGLVLSIVMDGERRPPKE
ncbi:MAG: AarF/ABC1/UbiB kinase family protein [Actinobacteria bacterium]|nr:AarF/ABC1/UbiB kinase family protein [Actinomycetota bacterium]